MVISTLTGMQETLDTYKIKHDSFDFESELGWEVRKSIPFSFFFLAFRPFFFFFFNFSFREAMIVSWK